MTFILCVVLPFGLDIVGGALLCSTCNWPGHKEGWDWQLSGSFTYGVFDAGCWLGALWSCDPSYLPVASAFSSPDKSGVGMLRKGSGDISPLRPSIRNYAQWILHIPFVWAYSPMHISEGTLETRNTVRPFLETTVCSVGMRSHFNWLMIPHVPFHPREQTPSGGFCGGQENPLYAGVITTHNFLPNESCPSSPTSTYPKGRTLTHVKSRLMWIWDFYYNSLRDR